MKRVSCLVLLVIVLAAGWLCLRGNSSEQDRDAVGAAASRAHLAGTDELGRDRATRLAAAIIFGLLSAVLAAAVSTSIALAISMGAAFAPPVIRSMLLYAGDLCLMLPWLYLLMLLRSALPLNLPAYASATVIFGLLALLGWPVYVRSLYQRAVSLRGEGWLLQARASGQGALRIARMHLLPHLRPLYLTQFLLCIPAFIVAEANLGALGMGVSAPLVSWGSLLQELASSAQLAATRWVYLPLALLVAVLFSLELMIPED